MMILVRNILLQVQKILQTFELLLYIKKTIHLSYSTNMSPVFVLSLWFINILIITKSEEKCRGIYDANGNPIQPLGVCVESSDYGGSGKTECNDNGEAIIKGYATDDCTLVSTEIDFNIDYSNVTCNGDKRCPYAIIREYTNTDCSKGDVFVEYTTIVNICIKNDDDTTSEIYKCTDYNVTKEEYDTTNCQGTPTEITTEYQDGLCTGGISIQEVIDCNMDKANIIQINIIFFVSLTIYSLSLVL